MDRTLATKDLPLLNRDEPYVPDAGRTYEDDVAVTYDAAGVMKERTHLSQADFERIYNSTMRYYTVQEKHMFKKYQRGEEKPEVFFKDCEVYLKRNFPEMQNQWDFKVMMNRLNVSIFGYDVIQPLIDNPDTSDIKICSPYDIRVRVKGKAYKSNATFIDENDLYRFVEGLAIRNHVDIFSHPVVTFTDPHDANYVLRFTVSSPMVCAVDYPYLHIRKVPKKKATFDDLIKAKMLPEKVKLYLIDRAKASKGIVFAGPPGCVDCETEFFNGKEWKSIATWNNEPVLQFDTNTNEASLVMPERYIKELCDKMYHFETENLNQTLSEEHRVIYYDESNSVKEMSALEFVETHRKGSFFGKFRTNHLKEEYATLPSDCMIYEVVPSDGFKYCFTVPTHALVLRRNNKIFVTGNSGKSTALNAFIEYIPKTRETLVIQENDELSTEQSGFMFKHVTHGFQGEPECTLEDLAKMALVEGCNEFIIGEVKGGEMRYAMTLVNAGGNAALTVHSTNAYETLDKLADLVKYGSDYSFEEARRMLKTFDTIVYMEGFKIREILECTGYNDEKKAFEYVNIYRYMGE